MRGKLTSFSEVNANISLLISLCYLNYLLDVLVISTLNLKWGGGGEWWVEMGSRYEVGQENMSYEFLYNRT